MSGVTAKFFKWCVHCYIAFLREKQHHHRQENTLIENTLIHGANKFPRRRNAKILHFGK